MPIPFKPRIYIAGKMTGLSPEMVYEKFHRAARWIESNQFEAVLPPLNDLSPEMWYNNMLICLNTLLECDVIYLLQDWENSDGAKVEYLFARKAQKIIIKQKNNDLSYLDDLYILKEMFKIEKSPLKH